MKGKYDMKDKKCPNCGQELRQEDDNLYRCLFCNYRLFHNKPFIANMKMLSSQNIDEIKKYVGMDPVRRYQTSPSFHALVRSIVLVFTEYYFTPECVKDAVLIAQKIIHDHKIMNEVADNGTE